MFGTGGGPSLLCDDSDQDYPRARRAPLWRRLRTLALGPPKVASVRATSCPVHGTGGGPPLSYDDADLDADHEHELRTSGSASVTTASSDGPEQGVLGPGLGLGDIPALARGPVADGGSEGHCVADDGSDAEDSLPGLLDVAHVADLDTSCFEVAGDSSEGHSAADAGARLGEVDLGWCGSLPETAGYLGYDLASLLRDLAPIAAAALGVPAMALLRRDVLDVVTALCREAQAGRARAAAVAEDARRTAATARYEQFAAAAAASPMIRNIQARLLAAAVDGPDRHPSVYPDTLFAAALDAVSFYGTIRGSWWTTFPPRARRLLDSIALGSGHRDFADHVDRIVGGGGISCAHEPLWAALANPTAFFASRRAGEPVWGEPGRSGPCYEDLHRQAHLQRLHDLGGLEPDLTPCHGAFAERLGYASYDALVQALCGDLRALDAHVVNDGGSGGGPRGASWSYLAEGAAQRARVRSWRVLEATGWHVDDACPNVRADAASGGGNPLRSATNTIPAHTS